MKLLFFDDFRLGVLKGDAVIDVSQTVRDIPHTGPSNLITGLIERFVDYKERLRGAADGGRGVPVSQVRIRPPLPKPYNIVAMAVNILRKGPGPSLHPSMRSTSPPAASSAMATPWCSPMSPPASSRVKRS